MTADVERLSRRLASTPAPFRSARPANVRVDAIVADLFRDRASRRLGSDEVARFCANDGSPQRARHLELVLVSTWLLHDPAFAGAHAERLLALLEGRLAELAGIAMPRKFIEDAERREELVRTCLSWFGVVPDGETREAAEDRLATLDSVKRKALLADARAREEARELERQRRKAELERVRQQEEEERRQAARTTFED